MDILTCSKLRLINVFPILINFDTEKLNPSYSSKIVFSQHSFYIILSSL